MVKVVTARDGEPLLASGWHHALPYHRAYIVCGTVAYHGPSVDPLYGEQTGYAATPVARTVMGEEVPVTVGTLNYASLVGLI